MWWWCFSHCKSPHKHKITSRKEITYWWILRIKETIPCFLAIFYHWRTTCFPIISFLKIPYRAYLSLPNITFAGVKPFKCNMCDKSFTQRCSLEAHVTRVHGLAHKFSFRERRPKVYVCEDCGTTFNENSKFRQHVKEHHSCNISSQMMQFN